MKVLLLTEILSNGGLERQLALLATSMPREWDVRVLSMGGGPFVEYLRARGVPVAVSERRGRFDAGFLPDLWRALTTWRPDVVHSWGWISTLSAGPMCRALRIPLVDGAIRTATPPKQFVALKRVGMAAATVVVANSRAGLASWRVPPRKGQVVYNGFDVSRLRGAERTRSTRDDFRVVMVGRMEPEKDFATIIEAARLLSSGSDGWSFSLVGDGSERTRLQSGAADLVGRGVVEFAGGGIEVLDIVGRADAGVLMTDPRVAQEGCSNAIMEYMACGLPVVCGDGGGNPELVVDGVTGFIVPQGRPDAVADRLRRLREDRSRCSAMGEAGKTRVLEEFSVEQMVEHFLDIYREVLGGDGSHAGSAPAGRPEEGAGTAGIAGAGDGLRVLMLMPYPHVQGPLPVIVPALTEQLRAMGCHVETDLWSRHADDESVAAKVVGRASDLLRIVAHLARGRFDVLFVPTAHNWAGLVRDLPLMLASRAVCPHRVVHFHGSEVDELVGPGRPVFKALSRALVRRCDAVLLLSEQERAMWSSFEPRGRFDVVLNPFLPSARSPRAVSHGVDAEDRLRPEAGTTILFVGRLIQEKGVLDVVEAARLLLLGGESPRVLIAGSGPVAGEVREMVRSFALGDRVILLGHLGADELQGAYQEADLLALPTYWAEGFPTVIPEAMHAGLPIVTTPIRGAADQLTEGENALFVPPRRPDLLAAAIRRLAHDPALRARMGEANRAKVTGFAPEVVAVRYLDILRNVADGGGAARDDRGTTC
jgi:glycosyltransferase involved in cell wall biosynthesis